MSVETANWLKSGAHLPSPIRDFHDAKDTFKSLHEWIGKPVQYGYPELILRDMERQGCTPELIEQVRSAMSISWVDGQCYVIDYFLRFMAACGWTMQRCRARVEFADLSRIIADRRQREAEVMREAFASTRLRAASEDAR